MKKVFFILASGLSLLILYIIFDFYVLKDRTTLNQTDDLSPLSCDLNIENCTYNFKNREVLVSMDPKPLQSLEITNLKIKNLGNYKNLKIKIYSLNSYIGNIIPQFTNTKDAIIINFTGKSVTDDSRFRVEFLNNDKPTGFFFDFDVTLQKIYNSAILPQN
ncbi:hypothetical protein [Campylobacter coli]|uniref:hypothetical protein n=1 Tax=Campylobacter coli TaxID=195 RepID=UPI001F26B735|nr:hypothetical protein [Campylobacter coli]